MAINKINFYTKVALSIESVINKYSNRNSPSLSQKNHVLNPSFVSIRKSMHQCSYDESNKKE